MAPYYPPPDENKLLQPLLACLPLAFISSRPPPALLPILSPILRQRVKLLSETRSTSDASWLPLLCWETDDANELPGIIENVSFEAHPVSGEMEFGDVERAQYRRLDEETLQARSSLPDLGLAILYTWCTNDIEGGDDGWRISEFKPLKPPSVNESHTWYMTVSEADERHLEDLDQHSRATTVPTVTGNGTSNHAEEEKDDDDDYWAQYDQRQGETPGHSQIPTPAPMTRANGNVTREDDYYSRYDSVQPAMDAEDPEERNEAIGESSLRGDLLVRRHANHELEAHTGPEDNEHIVHPRPSSASSGSSIKHLEQTAEQQSQAEIAIQQHISSSIKSLYRLTRGAGIDSTEFRRLVENELQCLRLMDEE